MPQNDRIAHPAPGPSALSDDCVGEVAMGHRAEFHANSSAIGVPPSVMGTGRSPA